MRILNRTGPRSPLPLISFPWPDPTCHSHQYPPVSVSLDRCDKTCYFNIISATEWDSNVWRRENCDKVFSSNILSELLGYRKAIIFLNSFANKGHLRDGRVETGTWSVAVVVRRQGIDIYIATTKRQYLLRVDDVFLDGKFSSKAQDPLSVSITFKVKP